ncbi:MAG: GNAT family N-acetyltransferase [Paludibacter sp.]
MSINIRQLEEKDNELLAELIRKVFREFKINKPGTVYDDPTTNHLYELFRREKSAYWVVEENGKIWGGCGLFPTEGLPIGCAELVKFYLTKESRGKGIGKLLLQIVINSAKEIGYTQLYLESFPELVKAISMYEKAGFNITDTPLGNSGHHACTIWMLREL